MVARSTRGALLLVLVVSVAGGSFALEDGLPRAVSLAVQGELSLSIPAQRELPLDVHVMLLDARGAEVEKRFGHAVPPLLARVARKGIVIGRLLIRPDFDELLVLCESMAARVGERRAVVFAPRRAPLTRLDAPPVRLAREEACERARGEMGAAPVDEYVALAPVSQPRVVARARRSTNFAAGRWGAIGDLPCAVDGDTRTTSEHVPDVLHGP